LDFSALIVDHYLGGRSTSSSQNLLLDIS